MKECHCWICNLFKTTLKDRSNQPFGSKYEEMIEIFPFVTHSNVEELQSESKCAVY